jgi:hypothetical protein
MEEVVMVFILRRRGRAKRGLLICDQSNAVVLLLMLLANWVFLNQKRSAKDVP